MVKLQNLCLCLEFRRMHRYLHGGEKTEEVVVATAAVVVAGLRMVI